MREHERDRIAAALNMLRPDWPVKQLRTLLDSPQLADRPRRDVCVALAWVACEANTANPYRVIETGPWWKAAAIEGTTSSNRDNPDKANRCSVCSLSEPRCRQLQTGNPELDHDYQPATVDNKRPPDAMNAIVGDLRTRLQPTTTPEPPVEHAPDPDGPAARARAAIATENNEGDAA